MPGLNLPMLCSEFVNKDIKLGEKTKAVIVVTKSWLVDSGHVYQTHAALNTTSLCYYNTIPPWCTITIIPSDYLHTHFLPIFTLEESTIFSWLNCVNSMEGKRKIISASESSFQNKNISSCEDERVAQI